MDVIRISSYLWPLFLLITKVSAGSDPVAWSLTPAKGFSAVELGGSTSATYTLTNRLPFSTTLRTRYFKEGGEFIIQDGCNQRNLKPNTSCTIGITFSPLNSGQSAIQLVYGYHNNEIPLPKLTALGKGQEPDENISGTFSSLPATFTLSNPMQQPTFTITYTNTGSRIINGYAGNGGGANLLTATPISVATVSILGNTCGTANNPVILHPGNFCQIQGQLTPLGLGSVTVSGLFTYEQGLKTITPTAHSTVINGSGACTPSVTATLPLPSTTYQYADNVVEFTFENECATGGAPLGLVTVNSTFTPSGGTAVTTIGQDNCSNTTIPPQGNCKVLASVISNSSNATINITASALSGSTTVASTTSAPVLTPTYQHNVTFINQCPFPVWYGVANDNNTDKSDPTNPAAPSDYLLSAQQPGSPPATKTLTFPGTYLGLFFGRTGCQTIGGQLFCETAQCTPSASPNGGKCSLGVEAPPPFTKIEMNFFATAQGDGSFDGDYDISLIEGFNIPVEMKAFGPGATIIPFPPTANNSAFQCGAPGAPFQGENPPTPNFPLGSCPWVVTPPSTNTMEPQFFNFVTDGDTAAGQNNCSCTAENPVCGIAFKATDPQKGNLIMSCGQLLGSWALKTLCTQPFATTVTLTANNDSRLRFNCDELISNVAGTQPAYTPGTTLSDLYGCVFNTAQPTILNSCYLTNGNSTTYCCGATDWNTTTPYVTVQDQQSTIQNPDWGGPTVGGISPIVPSPYESIVWYKTACPTAYAYPFDDHSTSFFCKQSSPGVNVKMDYQVVYCPGGFTGQ